MRLRMGSTILVLSMFLLMPAAHAGTIDFTLSGGDSASIAIMVSTGIVTSIAGTFDGSTILSLLPIDSIGGNDNVYTGTVLSGYKLNRLSWLGNRSDFSPVC